MSLENLDIAMDYALHGFKVVPLDEKLRMLTPNLLYDATTDFYTLTKLWEKHPKATVGLQTGRANGLVVLEFPRSNDLVGFEKSFGLSVKDHPVRATSKDGRLQLYYRMPTGVILGSRRNVKGMGFGIRADKTYVPAPDGKLYRLEGDEFGCDPKRLLRLPEMPQSIIEHCEIASRNPPRELVPLCPHPINEKDHKVLVTSLGSHDATNHADWLATGFVFSVVYHGSEEGLHRWMDWARNSGSPFDEKAHRYTWNKYKNKSIDASRV